MHWDILNIVEFINIKRMNNSNKVFKTILFQVNISK